MTSEFQTFLQNHLAVVKPLFREKNLTYFQASVTGEDTDYRKAADLQLQLARIYASRDDFAFLEKVKASGSLVEPLLQRQLDVLYRSYLARQVDENILEQIIQRQNRIEQRFATFRVHLDGRELTDNQIEELLQQSTDSQQLEKVWLASKGIGEELAEDILSLVELRNQVATTLGFDHYHAMQLHLSEQDPQNIEKLFDELDELTRKAFAEAKGNVDEYLAARFGLEPSQLMPWHYQNRFFQEAPKIYELDLDSYYTNAELVQLTRDYFSGIGLPLDDVIQKSDLFERPDKYQHAYCLDIDREGDIRVVCNIKPNANWMSTLLHEFGHAAYDKFQDLQVPWLLREPAHVFTTEAIAMFFGRLATNARWMHAMLGLNHRDLQAVETTGRRILRLEQLVFSRWVQVVYRFEKQMYENPRQDLNRLWWDLVEEYQGLRRPQKRHAPDWATKIHVALYPAYYHNYMLGEVLASQLLHTLRRDVLENNDDLVDNPAIGAFLVEKVFKPGNTRPWHEMIQQATGAPLSPVYFVRQFVDE